VYNKYIINGGLQLGFVISKVIDRGVIELFGPFGFSTVFTNSGRSISQYWAPAGPAGVITSYALYIILGLISVIFLLFAPLMFSWAPGGPLVPSTADLGTGSMGLILLFLSTLVLLPVVSTSQK
jgi:NADH-ubiquinone oxidoreductase chain 5